MTFILILNYFNEGGTDLPRFSCANHKLGVVINLALIAQQHCLEILKTLVISNDCVRNSIKTKRLFRKMKCRLIIYQKIRWCWAVLLFLANKRAYD